MRHTFARVAKWFKPALPSPSHQAEQTGRRWRFHLPTSYIVIGAGLLVLGGTTAWEVRSSALQAKVLSRMAGNLSFTLRQGEAKRVHFPEAGPYDERLGYTAIPKFVSRLNQQGFVVDRQAEISPEHQEFIARGGYAIYREKPQAGLTVLDRDGSVIFAKSYPDSAYRDFTSVPPLVAGTLLFIEDRDLLDPSFPTKNPAVNWTRFSIAAAVHVTGLDYSPVRGGASTLATQLEKFRHSPGGRTASSEDKLKQMASASVRAYMNGPDSTTARQRILVDYLNATPLGSRPGFGEINGLADGLKVWYGTDFAQANRVLAQVNGKAPVDLKAAQIYKQVLSLLLAQRRPALYLRGDLSELDALANTHLTLLEQSGLIGASLSHAAQSTRLKMAAAAPAAEQHIFTERKAVDSIRTELLETLEAPGLYSLDRLDLSVRSTIDQDAQKGVTRTLKTLSARAGVEKAGLVGHNMLAEEDPSKVIYSVALYERGAEHHAVRVQTDSVEGPFNLNNSAKLILGSTAKLRTVATYLNIVYDLHQKYSPLPAKELRAAAADARDPLTAWAISHLSESPDKSLKAMLDAAMQRHYSASPYEAFYTGGGVMRFGNFNKDDNERILTVETALRQSVNLPMIRLMRDVVRYYGVIEETPAEGQVATDRAEYLRRFADKEGREYLSHFYAAYKDLETPNILAQLASDTRAAPASLAVSYLALRPQATPAALKSYLNAWLDKPIDDKEAAKLHAAYGPGKFSLIDSAFIARVHPLELWLAQYLQNTPKASRTEMMNASADVRQDVYQWLFTTRHHGSQDARIRTLREEDAFKRVLEEWRGQGYPFNQIIPSLATALGSSGDRPDALARLMGIILNEGVDVPITTVEGLSFAAHTPYETDLRYAPQRRPVRVFAPEVATTLREALLGVVEEGTAVRIHNALRDEQGRPLAVGGKTGTGDNEFKTFDANGNVTASRSVDRTATFAFFIGDRLFGTITAYVPGQESEKYTFTSSLVVQLLKTLAPEIQKLWRENDPNVVAIGNQEPRLVTSLK